MPTPPGRGEWATGEPRRRWTGQTEGPKLFKIRIAPRDTSPKPATKSISLFSRSRKSKR